MISFSHVFTHIIPPVWSVLLCLVCWTNSCLSSKTLPAPLPYVPFLHLTCVFITAGVGCIVMAHLHTPHHPSLWALSRQEPCLAHPSIPERVDLLLTHSMCAGTVCRTEWNPRFFLSSLCALWHFVVFRLVLRYILTYTWFSFSPVTWQVLISFTANCRVCVS